MLTHHTAKQKTTEPAITYSKIMEYQEEKHSFIAANELCAAQPIITLGDGEIDLELRANGVLVTRKDCGMSYALYETYLTLRATMVTPDILVCTSMVKEPTYISGSYRNDGIGLIRVFELSSNRCIGKEEYNQYSPNSLPLENLGWNRVLIDDKHCYSISPTVKRLFSLTPECRFGHMMMTGSNLFVAPYYKMILHGTDIREIRIYELDDEGQSYLHSIDLGKGNIEKMIPDHENSTIRILLSFYGEKSFRKTTQQELRIDVSRLFGDRILAAVPSLKKDQVGIIQSYLTGCNSTFYKQKEQTVTEKVDHIIKAGTRNLVSQATPHS